jgi:hypothetical protein
MPDTGERKYQLECEVTAAICYRARLLRRFTPNTKTMEG